MCIYRWIQARGAPIKRVKFCSDSSSLPLLPLPLFLLLPGSEYVSDLASNKCVPPYRGVTFKKHIKTV